MSQNQEPVVESLSQNELNEQSRVRREKLDNLRKEKRAYPHWVEVKNTSKELSDGYDSIQEKEELLKAGTFSLAGRVVFLRSFGKAGFVKIRDRKGEFQLYVARDNLSDFFADFKSLDLGDLVRAEGVLFRTKTGELSLQARHFQILSKSLHTPPEKFHGLQNIEDKYRRRYLDLMSSPDTMNVFIKRSEVVQKVREYFLARDFLEVETPMMHPLVSGAAAKPFVTHHNKLDRKLYLRIAPELYLKRLVVGGMERVFEINRNFRNEGMSVRHNPEFTMIEFYMAYANYHKLMDMSEELIVSLAKDICGTDQIEFQGTKIKLGRPWKRIGVETAVKEMSPFDGDLKKIEDMQKYLKSKKVEVNKHEGPGALLMKIFEEDVESKLIDPCFVTDFPVEVSPLARRAPETPESGIEVAERFELYINGVEIANGFNELNDPDDQKERFLAQQKEKEAGNEEATDYDEDYIKALEYALPPTAGEGIGIDRLVMLLTNSASIRDVILFPQMKDE